jgi:phage terminase large subunit
MPEVDAEFPPKLKFLFRPSRYKVAYGGRGGAKSWNFARALLIQGYDEPHRVLCAREVQKSIKDSVHQLLCDQIEMLGLASHYTVTRDEIRGANGTLFTFAGLSDLTADSLKSYEGLTRVWVEEAHKVTRKSWDKLIPTVRRPESEIWISLNPELDTDETYVRFILNPPESAQVVEINYRDNPWFPAVLEEERRAFLARVERGERSRDDYENIWEGKPRAAVEGAIYAREVQELQTQTRLCRIPYDPMLKVHRVWDLGWNDAMVVGMWQKSPMGMMLIDSMITSHQRYDEIVATLNQRKYRWGHDFMPHDARHKNPQTGKGADDVLKDLGCSPQIVPDIGLEAGIKAVRQAFPRIWLDTETGDNKKVLDGLKRYRRRIQPNGEPGSPEHDDASHPADMVRYAVVVADEMTNTDVAIADPYRAFRRFA